MILSDGLYKMKDEESTDTSEVLAGMFYNNGLFKTVLNGHAMYLHICLGHLGGPS